MHLSTRRAASRAVPTGELARRGAGLAVAPAEPRPGHERAVPSPRLDHTRTLQLPIALGHGVRRQPELFGQPSHRRQPAPSPERSALHLADDLPLDLLERRYVRGQVHEEQVHGWDCTTASEHFCHWYKSSGRLTVTLHSSETALGLLHDRPHGGHFGVLLIWQVLHLPRHRPRSGPTTSARSKMCSRKPFTSSARTGRGAPPPPRSRGSDRHPSAPTPSRRRRSDRPRWRSSSR